MTVSAYHVSRGQARILVAAVSSELAAQAPNYFGSGVRVQVIDAALDSRWYVKPNFVSNALFGWLVGLFIGAAWSLIRMPRREVLARK